MWRSEASLAAWDEPGDAAEVVPAGRGELPSGRRHRVAATTAPAQRSGMNQRRLGKLARHPPECVTYGASAAEHDPTTILKSTDRTQLTMRPGRFTCDGSLGGGLLTYVRHSYPCFPSLEEFV
jgi:hypothetical protein